MLGSDDIGRHTPALQMAAFEYLSHNMYKFVSDTSFRETKYSSPNSTPHCSAVKTIYKIVWEVRRVLLRSRHT